MLRRHLSDDIQPLICGQIHAGRLQLSHIPPVFFIGKADAAGGPFTDSFRQYLLPVLPGFLGTEHQIAGIRPVVVNDVSDKRIFRTYFCPQLHIILTQRRYILPVFFPDTTSPMRTVPHIPS